MRRNIDWNARFWLGAILTFGAVACGDDDGGDAGLDPNTLVSELTADEAARLCQEFENRAQATVGDLDEVACTIQGLIQTILAEGTVEDCEQAADECIEAGEPSELAECDLANATERADCDATVAEVRACNEAQIETLGPLVELLTCELVDDPDSFPEEPQTPEECLSLAETCPIYAEEDSE